MGFRHGRSFRARAYVNFAMDVKFDIVMAAKPVLCLAHDEGGLSAVALSDSCFEFLEAVRTAARKLSVEIEDYPLPPYAYDEELRALRRASNDVVDAPWSAEAGSRLLQLAAAVMTYHDTVPETPEA